MTVGEVLRALIGLHPGLQGYILDGEGGILPFVSVFLDGRDVRYLGGLDTPLALDSDIAIFPPVAGG